MGQKDYDMITKDYSFLLERPEWTFEESKIDAVLSDKRVIITGAGGSIGSALARRIANSPARRLVCAGHSELPIFNLRAALAGSKVPIEYMVQDVGRTLFSQFVSLWRPDYVIHAAAHKHVGLMESQPEQALRNNIDATIRISQAVSAVGGRLVYISTDKAANPTSIMGASKRLAEAWLLLRDPNVRICRFGNVLGSSGSLVEIIERRIAEGKTITLTSPDMARYFITVKEAVGLVLTSLLCEPGMYSLEMGNQIPIVNIAAKLSSAPIEFTRPGKGEKTIEDITGRGEWTADSPYPGVFYVRSMPLEREWVDQCLTMARRYPSALATIANLIFV